MFYKKNEYWKKETPETIEFGKKFFRYYEEAGKLQIGKVLKSKNATENTYIVKFVISRDELVEHDEAANFLIDVIEMWKNGM